MAEISIKGKKDALVVSEEVARKIKQRKLGDDFMHIAKAEPTDMVDIVHATGSWCGEYAKIGGISLDHHARTQESPQDKAIREQKEADAEWFRMSAEGKAEQLGMFKISWSMRNGLHRDIPADVIEKAKKIRTKYFTKYPAARDMPMEEYGALLRGSPVSIVKSM